jgi:hypothetical protein
MENNERYVRESASLHEGAAALVSRCVDTASLMIEGSLGAAALCRGGRKGHGLDARAQPVVSSEFADPPDQ